MLTVIGSLRSSGAWEAAHRCAPGRPHNTIMRLLIVSLRALLMSAATVVVVDGRRAAAEMDVSELHAPSVCFDFRRAHFAPFHAHHSGQPRSCGAKIKHCASAQFSEFPRFGLLALRKCLEPLDKIQSADHSFKLPSPLTHPALHVRSQSQALLLSAARKQRNNTTL